MKTIIAGTDFTTSSLNACKYAAMLSKKHKCKLILFNLFDTPIIHSNVGLYGFSYSSIRHNSLTKMGSLLKQLSKLFPGVQIDYFATNGSFKDQLEAFTATHKVEVAVMGLETKRRISKSIFGSHGVDIAGKINTPVIIVPENYKKHTLQQVLLAVDNHKKLHKTPIKTLQKFLHSSQAKLQLLHVRTDDEFLDPDPKIVAIKIGVEKLPIHMIRAEELQDGVKLYTKKKKTDMVCVISKKHSVLYNFFIESNTKKVAFASKIPVMAIHD